MCFSEFDHHVLSKICQYDQKHTLFSNFAHFAPLNDIRAYIAWSWKTTLIMWIFYEDDIQLQIQVLPLGAIQIVFISNCVNKFKMIGEPFWINDLVYRDNWVTPFEFHSLIYMYLEAQRFSFQTSRWVPRASLEEKPCKIMRRKFCLSSPLCR